jgi:predicted SAM-dependent methyltransferase
MTFRIGSAATRQKVKMLPGIWHARRAARKLRRAYYRHFGALMLRRMVASSSQKRIVIGAWGRYDSGWIPTQQDFLDLVAPTQWEHFFQPNSIDAMLAEHVWEHLTPDEARVAAENCFRYLKPGGYLRVAVPDGLHPDPAYIDQVKVNAPIPNDHKVLYTYRTLRDLFEQAGFRVALYEYFDEAGTFNFQEWDESGGTIWRSKRSHPDNKGGKLNHTSIILDAFKQ